MGDRIISYKRCPKCGKEYEVYDASSSLMYCAKCDNCGYDEGLSYIEVGSHNIYLVPTAVKEHIDYLESVRKDIRDQHGN